MNLQTYGRIRLLALVCGFLLVGGACSVVEVITVAGPAETQCGGFNWTVNFRLKEQRTRPGWLIQELVIDRRVFECNGAARPCPATFQLTFYEAWEVPAGQTAAVNPPGAVGIGFNDMYAMNDEGVSWGSTEATGSIRFFEGVALPQGFMVGNPNTIAGQLPSSLARPPFWNTVSEEDEHEAENEWDCCVTPPTRSFGSTPAIAGLPPSPRPIDMTHPVARSIDSIPAWTTPYENEEVQALRTTAAEIATLAPEEIRSGLAEFVAAQQGAVDGQSKAYLLLRAIFDVPSDMERSETKLFGGWVHPSVVDTEKPFNLLWPLAENNDGQLDVIGQFSGYFGAPYDALGEFDYFLARFSLRAR